METTGVVRRIDELGRIVIPKEIRRSLGIKDGASLEIYIDKDMVALKKYSTMNNLVELATIYSETVYSTMNLEMYVTDRDNIISCPNIRKKNYLNKQISKYLEECITKRTKIIDEDNKKIQLTNDDLIEGSHLISPILANGDVIGLVILLSNRKLTEAEKHIVNIASQFLGKNVEE
jgi:AbrB family transcriptional regulator (stage V sporulation protein T)